MPKQLDISWRPIPGKHGMPIALVTFQSGIRVLNAFSGHYHTLVIGHFENLAEYISLNMCWSSVSNLHFSL